MSEPMQEILAFLDRYGIWQILLALMIIKYKEVFVFASGVLGKIVPPLASWQANRAKQKHQASISKQMLEMDEHDRIQSLYLERAERAERELAALRQVIDAERSRRVELIQEIATERAVSADRMQRALSNVDSNKRTTVEIMQLINSTLMEQSKLLHEILEKKDIPN